jgi:hypothetical protein
MIILGDPRSELVRVPELGTIERVTRTTTCLAVAIG